MTENLDDLALWGATGDDDQVTPPPDMRRIGERLYVRPKGTPYCNAARLPLRLPVAFMRRCIEACDGLEQLDLVAAEMCDDLTRGMWEGLDSFDRVAVADRYFKEQQTLIGMAAGESSR